MSATQPPTFPGWYPDPSTGGTKYFDGSSWTGDARPRRRAFAAATAHRAWGITLTVFGCLAILTSPSAFTDQQSQASGLGARIGTFLLSIAVGFAFLAWGIYLLRGRGPTTKAVQARLTNARNSRDQVERKVAESRNRSVRGSGAPRHDLRGLSAEALEAARLNALANPETAKALQNLQNLLYTHAISDSEFDSAKGRLLGTTSEPRADDAAAQIMRLAELHRSGVLSDYEFASAKARILDI